MCPLRKRECSWGRDGTAISLIVNMNPSILSLPCMEHPEIILNGRAWRQKWGKVADGSI
jgi:hypothetical protein